MNEPKSFLGVMVSSTFTAAMEHHKALIELLPANDLHAKKMEHPAVVRANAHGLDSSAGRQRLP